MPLEMISLLDILAVILCLFFLAYCGYMTARPLFCVVREDEDMIETASGRPSRLWRYIACAVPMVLVLGHFYVPMENVSLSGREALTLVVAFFLTYFGSDAYRLGYDVAVEYQDMLRSRSSGSPDRCF